MTRMVNTLVCSHRCPLTVRAWPTSIVRLSFESSRYVFSMQDKDDSTLKNKRKTMKIKNI